MVGIRQQLDQTPFTYEQLQEVSDEFNKKMLKTGGEPYKCMSFEEYIKQNENLHNKLRKVYDGDDTAIIDLLQKKLANYLEDEGIEDFDEALMTEYRRGLSSTFSYNKKPFLWMSFPEEKVSDGVDIIYFSQGYRDLAKGKNRRLQKRKSSFNLMTGKRIS